MTKTNILILIPSSERKTAKGNQPPLQTIHPLAKQILKELNSHPHQEKLLGVKGKKLEESIQANKSILKSKTLPAIQRYSGVVFEGIDYQSIKNKSYFDKHIRIISALFGLVSPQQLIPDYKLKIEKLNAAKLWRPILSEELKNTYIIDLLPQAQRKAVYYEEGIQVEFVIEKNNNKTRSNTEQSSGVNKVASALKRVPAGHNGKFIKGRFIRWLVEKKIVNSQEFKNFKEDGFKWNGEYFLKRV